MNRQDDFLRLSQALTGFGRFELLGTGMADDYLRQLQAVVPEALLDTLLGALRDLPKGTDDEPAAASRILADPDLKPVAQSLIVLWYTGSWVELPPAWQAAHGHSPQDRTRTLSGDAYLAGLQWAAAGAHPSGGRMQGFGAWSIAPEVARHD